MDMSNIPTPDEMDAARKACGPTTPISILMGWVMGQRREALKDDIKESLK